MFALLAFAGQLIESPLLRMVLENGAIVHAQQIEGARRFSAQLVVATPEPEIPSQHGRRHLLEHLLAKRLDRILERDGLYLIAATSRETMRFEVIGAPEKVARGIEALARLLERPHFAEDAATREAPILAEELALTADSRRLSGAAWQAVFGGQGLDPLGTLAAMRAASSEELTALHGQLFIGPRLVLTIAGPDPASRTGEMGRSALSAARAGERPAPAPRAANEPDDPLRVAGARGHARALTIPGLPDPEALAALGLAMAAAAEEDGDVLFTPSARPGVLVAIGARDLAHPSLHLPARRLLAAWMESADREPSLATTLRGALLASDPTLTLETLRAAILRLGSEEFRAAARRWRDDGFDVEGVGSDLGTLTESFPRRKPIPRNATRLSAKGRWAKDPTLRRASNNGGDACSSHLVSIEREILDLLFSGGRESS